MNETHCICCGMNLKFKASYRLLRDDGERVRLCHSCFSRSIETFKPSNYDHYLEQTKYWKEE